MHFNISGENSHGKQIVLFVQLKGEHKFLKTVRYFGVSRCQQMRLISVKTDHRMSCTLPHGKFTLQYCK